MSAIGKNCLHLNTLSLFLCDEITDRGIGCLCGFPSRETLSIFKASAAIHKDERRLRSWSEGDKGHSEILSSRNFSCHVDMNPTPVCRTITHLDISWCSSLTDLSILLIAKSFANLVKLDISDNDWVTDKTLQVRFINYIKIPYRDLVHMENFLTSFLYFLQIIGTHADKVTRLNVSSCNAVTDKGLKFLLLGLFCPIKLDRVASRINLADCVFLLYLLILIDKYSFKTRSKQILRVEDMADSAAKVVAELVPPLAQPTGFVLPIQGFSNFSSLSAPSGDIHQVVSPYIRSCYPFIFTFLTLSVH